MLPIEPMLAKLTPAIPEGPGWLFEPKWDGFRTILAFDGATVTLQSRDLKPLGRYFPEVVEGVARVLPGPVVLDGETVIMGPRGIDFEALQLRLHPAESRVRKLAGETPAAFVAFDMLSEGGEDLRARPFAERRARLEAYLAAVPPPVYLTPATGDRAVAQDQLTAPQHRVRGVDGEAHQPLARPVGAGSLNRRAAEEVDVGLQLAGEQQTGLDGVLTGCQLTAEGAVALLQPHRLDGVVAAAADAEAFPDPQ